MLLRQQAKIINFYILQRHFKLSFTKSKSLRKQVRRYFFKAKLFNKVDKNVAEFFFFKNFVTLIKVQLNFVYIAVLKQCIIYKQYVLFLHFTLKKKF